MILVEILGTQKTTLWLHAKNITWPNIHMQKCNVVGLLLEELLQKSVTTLHTHKKTIYFGKVRNTHE